uniref:Uncharacterized protein n=1 Tax=Rhipicephalus appendiculatus TaxID=34631 RepID=A0A131Z0N2_RHIAP
MLLPLAKLKHLPSSLLFMSLLLFVWLFCHGLFSEHQVQLCISFFADRFAIGVVELLAFLVKEKPHFLEGPGIYPSLITKDIDGATVLCAVFEGLELEVVDSIAGFVLLLEMYWVFNIKYDQQNKNTFDLVEHFCELPASKAPSLVIMRAISAIRKSVVSPEKK